LLSKLGLLGGEASTPTEIRLRAQRALGEEPSERNFAWLLDVQGRLAAIEGTEASIEGFGALSGRPARGL